MKRLALAFAVLLISLGSATAQCNGVFGANTICGRLTSPGLPVPLPNNVLTGVPGGTNGQIQYNNLSNFGGFTVGGDATLTPASGALTLTPSGVIAGIYGGGRNIPVIIFDAKGRATSATEISPAAFTGGLSPAAGTLGAVPAPTAAMSALGYVLGAAGNWVGLSKIGGLNLTTPIDAGAACDGTTNDTSAIQRWLSSLSGYSAIGWGIQGRTCLFNGLLSIGSNTRMYLNDMTFKLINSGNANSGFVCGPTSQMGGPINNVNIAGGIFDGNRTNQTNTLGGGALLYCVSVSNLTIEDTQFTNGRADGLYIGGDSRTLSGFGGRSSYVTLRNVVSTGNYRNGVSIVGVSNLIGLGGKFNSNTNTNNDGPMAGIDFEPDPGGFSTNTDIQWYGGEANSNGQGTQGYGWEVAGSVGDSARIMLYGINANSNNRYGFVGVAGMSVGVVSLHGLRGENNGLGLNEPTAAIRDWFPTSIAVSTANSCGAGFRCVGLPN